MRLRVTLLHDGSNADVEAALTTLWRAISPAEVDVRLVTLEQIGLIPGVRVVRGARLIEPYLSRDRCDVVHAWLAAPAFVCGLMRLWPDRPAVISGVPGRAVRLDNSPMASAAHIAGGFLADLVTTWHADTVDWLVRNGLPSDAVAQVEDPTRSQDPVAVARSYVRLYDEVASRRRPIWRRFVKLPSL